MGKFNFKNYDRKNRNYGNNDLNIDRLFKRINRYSQKINKLWPQRDAKSSS